MAHIAKKGMLFRHSKWLDPDYSGEPLSCKVTAVRRGIVYYRPFYGYRDDGTEWLGSPVYIEHFKFDSIVSMLGARSGLYNSANKRDEQRAIAKAEGKD